MRITNWIWGSFLALGLSACGDNKAADEGLVEDVIDADTDEGGIGDSSEPSEEDDGHKVEEDFEDTSSGSEDDTEGVEDAEGPEDDGQGGDDILEEEDGNEQDGGNQGDVLLSASEVLDLIAELECKTIQDCTYEYSDTRDVANFAFLESSSQARCVELQKPRLRDRFEDVLGMLEEERIFVEEEAFQACIAEAEDSCLGTNEVMWNCLPAFYGKIPVGDACRDTRECEVDAYCADESGYPNGHNVCEEGICRSKGKRGDDCIGDISCSQSEGSSICNIDQVCKAYRVELNQEEGAHCSALELVDAVVNYVCKPGLVCHGSDAGFACRAPIQVGELCHDIPILLPCEAGATCVVGDTESRCEAIAVVNDEGEACSGTDLAYNDSNQLCNLLNGLACEDGTCKTWTDEGVVGDFCPSENLGDAYGCMEGLYCDWYSSRCVEKKPTGFVGCYDDVQCASGFCVWSDIYDDGECVGEGNANTCYPK